ncbi:MAG TPA: restriction endonuclease subunit S [Thermodesulfobacteriota bacterium]
MWDLVPLSDVLTERQEVPKAEDILRGKIKIISKIGFDDGEIELRRSSDTRTEMILVRSNDLVVSGINAAKGAIAIHRPGTEPIAATIHYAAYEPKSGKGDARYLWWLLRSNTFRTILNESLPGGIKTELKPKRLLSVKVPLPPYKDQLHIVSRLEDLIGRAKEVTDVYRSGSNMGASIMMAAMREMRLRMLKERTRVSRIGDITTVTSGGTPDRNNPAYWGGSIPWIKTGELLDDYNSGSEENITELGLANSSAKMFTAGTVLIALYGQGQTRGRTGILTKPSTTNQGSAAILPNPDLFDSRYLQYWLRSLYDEMREQTRDGAQPNWNGTMIKAIEICLPSTDQQREIVEHLDAVSDRIKILHEIHSSMKPQVDALVPSILDKTLKDEVKLQ